jgi:hypothetical protein
MGYRSAAMGSGARILSTSLIPASVQYYESGVAWPNIREEIHNLLKHAPVGDLVLGQGETKTENTVTI